MRPWILVGGLVAIALSLGHRIPPTDGGALDGMPALMLWAWERPEDLTGIDVARVGVAVLAGTLRLRDDDVIVRPRRQPVRVPEGTALAAVVRIEPDRSAPPSLSRRQEGAAVDAIVALAAPAGVRLVQVDFDATVTQREFYRALLNDLRPRLPATTALSITALASWCLGDPWLIGLPIDEAVPMLFRMGADGQNVRRHLARGGEFGPDVCRRAVGVATDEPLMVASPPAAAPGVRVLPRGSARRQYVFHPRPWSDDSIAAVLARPEVSR